MKDLNIRLYILIQLFIYFISKIYSIKIEIKNNEKVMQNLSNTINDRQTDELKLIFNENYYNISTLSNNNFSVQKNLIFYSEKGTIFDFHNTHQTSLAFNIKPDTSLIKIKFYNITFFNYFDEALSNGLSFFSIPINHNNYEIEYNNCKFIQIKGYLFIISYDSVKVTQTTPQLIFNNCSFM